MENQNQVTDEDLNEERRELEKVQEQEHAKHMEELDNLIEKLEAQRDKVVKEGCIKIEELKQLKIDKEEQLQDAELDLEDALTNLKCQLTHQISAHRVELGQLQARLVTERRDLAAKQGHLAQLRLKATDDEDQRRQDIQILKALISQEETLLLRMQRDHEGIMEKYETEADLKRRTHLVEKQALQRKIDAVKANSLRTTEDFKMGEERLLEQQKDLQKELENEFAKKNTMVPLRNEKLKLAGKVQEKLNHITELRLAQEADIEMRIKQFEDQHTAMQNVFFKQREMMEAEIFEKECEAQDKELRVEKLRADNAEKVALLDGEFIQAHKNRETALEEKEENNRKERLRIKCKENLRELQEIAHQKTLEIATLEANHKAEEDLLRVWLDSLEDREAYLRGVLRAKSTGHGTKMMQIDKELNNAMLEAENSILEFEGEKTKLEKKILAKKQEFEEHIRRNTEQVSKVNNQVVELRHGLDVRVDNAEDRKKELEKRIGDEKQRLLRIRSQVEEEMTPMKAKLAEQKAKLVDERETHKNNLIALRKQHQEQCKRQEEELTAIYDEVEALRSEFKKERRDLQDNLNEMLVANDQLRNKLEQEIYDLNIKLIQGKLNKDGAEDSPVNMANKLQKLQETYAKKAKEYQNTLTRTQEEKHEIRAKHEKEAKALFTQVQNLTKECMKDKNMTAADVVKLEKTLEAKTQELEEAKAFSFPGQDSKTHLRAQVDVAKQRTIQLQQEIEQRRSEVSKLKDRKTKEIAILQAKLDFEDLDSIPVGSTTNPIKEKIRKLKKTIKGELQERKELLNVIASQDQGASTTNSENTFTSKES